MLPLFVESKNLESMLLGSVVSVEATENLNRDVDGALGLRFVHDVEGNSPHTLSELASNFGELLRIAGRGHDAVSGLENLFCERPAQAAGSSGS
jgi:hypothetical protein